MSAETPLLRLAWALTLLSLPACHPAGAAQGSPKPAPAQGLAPETTAALWAPQLARRIPADIGQAHTVNATAVIVGERWGCAPLQGEGAAAWQCWRATTPGQAPRAFRVPWLAGKQTLLAGPERVCAYEKALHSLRCWRPPVVGQTAGVELPVSQQGTFTDTDPTDHASQAVLGGTFSCLKSASSNVWCVGDDGFGQLGTGRSNDDVRRPQPIPVWPAHVLALGAFHGCALAAPGGLLNGAFVSCWGRGDAGQLGVPAPDICAREGSAVPCARTPTKGPAVAEPMMAMTAGDLFTCVSDPEGIRCWGGARDGFFGHARSCPKSLEQAWPTLGAPVPAPSARCSQKPVVIVSHPGSHDFDPGISAGPRGLCFNEGGVVRCLGAVPSPRDAAFVSARVSPGQDASACSLERGNVRCWGEAYSATEAPGTPVTIALEPPIPAREVAVVGVSDASEWADTCLVKRGCTVTPGVVPPCAPGAPARSWSELLAAKPSLVGKLVQVRGRLAVGPSSSARAGCFEPGVRACCNRANAPIVLSDSATTKLLSLQGLACSGDDSQLCCNAPAFGQAVVASGELLLDPEAVAVMSYHLAHATICREPAAAPTQDSSPRPTRPTDAR